MAALAAEGSAGPALVDEVEIERPLVIPEDGGGDDAPEVRAVQFVVGPEDGSASRRWEVFSRASAAESWVRHATGRLDGRANAGSAGASRHLPEPDVDRLRRSRTALDVENLYEAVAASGIGYGHAFRGLVRLWSGRREAVGEVVRPDGLEEVGAGVHPALLDAFFHTLGGVESLGGPDGTAAGVAWLPVGWARLRLNGQLPERIVCHARVLEGAGPSMKEDGIRMAELSAYSDEGEEVLRITGLTLRRADRSALLAASRGVRDLLYELVWREDRAGMPGPEVRDEVPGAWLVAAGGRDSLAAAAVLADGLRDRGRTVVMASEEAEGVSRVEPTDRDSWRCLVESLVSDGPLAGVVHVGGRWGRDPEPAELREELAESMSSTLALVQGLDDAGVSPGSGLCLVTWGGQVLGEERDEDLAGSVIWGFARTAALELPGVRVRLLDLEPGDPAAVERLADELLYPDGETQVAIRGGRRHVARLARSGRRMESPLAGGWRLARDPGGALAQVGIEVVEQGALEPGEVRVAVEASGLNFLDVMSGMGLVEVDAPLGVEFCGRVLAVGAGVEGLSEGERVVGFGAGAFGPELVTRAELVVPAPGRHSAAALATIPVAFVTAALAFEWAGLEAGDAVLVHAGSGGVGHAAIQWARAAGLEVVATASAGKREHVRGLGVSEVFDSRSAGFGEEVLEATGGAGVRMVLEQPDGGGFHRGESFVFVGGGPFRGAREAGDLG